ncbi:hypothetical protein GCM10010405_23990 [Streptomyces macrosporus]|uniref:Uncharacterized protein n=1 Tax=Streptomyces macrosporus TaxID=44032 RepID=A0ABP5WY07_9ACTN
MDDRESNAHLAVVSVGVDDGEDGEVTAMSSDETDGLRDGERCPPSGEATNAGPVPSQSRAQTVDGGDQRSTPSAGGADPAADRDEEQQHERGFWSRQHRKLEIAGTALTVVAGIVGLVFLQAISFGVVGSLRA